MSLLKEGLKYGNRPTPNERWVEIELRKVVVNAWVVHDNYASNPPFLVDAIHPSGLVRLKFAKYDEYKNNIEPRFLKVVQHTEV
ncbi:MAG: hypothetical protein RLZZ283_717 [Candidatus Parcubacteria bacterium]|jgi:hypothetical protein